jgi:hypothetical protein
LQDSWDDWHPKDERCLQGGELIALWCWWGGGRTQRFVVSQHHRQNPQKHIFFLAVVGWLEQEYNTIQNTCDGPGPLHISSDLTLTNLE